MRAENERDYRVVPSDDELDACLDAFHRVGRELGLVSG